MAQPEPASPVTGCVGERQRLRAVLYRGAAPLVLPRADRAFRGRAGLEHDYGGWMRAARSERFDVVAPPGVVVELRPQALPLLAPRDAGADGSRTLGQVHGRVWLRLEVQPPRGIGFCPPVHGERDEIGAVLVVADHHETTLTGTSPDRVEAHRPEPCTRLGPLKSETTARRPRSG
jgi:hypothetical protein